MVDKLIVTYLNTAFPLFKQSKEKKTDKCAVTETLETRNTSVLHRLETGKLQRKTKAFPSCIIEG
jgi:hypothetical protein